MDIIKLFTVRTLAKIALFYSGNGSESDARTVFEEALQAAEKGATEKGSGGYGRISQAMVDDPKRARIDGEAGGSTYSSTGKNIKFRVHFKFGRIG